MKALILTLALVAAGPAVADPVLGTWKTLPDNNGNFGHVQMVPCEGKVCGVLVEAFDGAGTAVGSPNVGKAILWDMTARGDGTYDEGKIFSPDNNRTYNARMSLAGNQLSVGGCVLGFCRDQIWTRLP